MPPASGAASACRAYASASSAPAGSDGLHPGRVWLAVDGPDGMDHRPVFVPQREDAGGKRHHLSVLAALHVFPLPRLVLADQFQDVLEQRFRRQSVYGPLLVCKHTVLWL